MTNARTALLILLIHTGISLAYLAAACLRKLPAETKCAALAMLLSPPVGAVFFACGFVMRKLMNNERQMQLDDIGFSKDRHNRTVRPDVEREMQVVPFEEVLLVSDDREKRSRLLTQLKKDDIRDYSAIKKALDSDDPETSHYAASALTSAKAGFENRIREMDGVYVKNTGDSVLVRSYADFVWEYLESGVLEPMEERKYSYLYINLMASGGLPDDFRTERDYARIVDRALYVGDFAAAARWADASFRLGESEAAYMNLLKTYYYTNRQPDFLRTLGMLKSSDIPLSVEGLSLVRFFAARKSREEAGYDTV